MGDVGVESKVAHDQRWAQRDIVTKQCDFGLKASFTNANQGKMFQSAAKIIGT